MFIANPIGTFWTACLMLEPLGEPTAAARLMSAIEPVTATTRQVTEGVIARIQAGAP